MAFPIIHYVLIKDVGQKMISLNAIVLCIAGVVFPVVWNKYSSKLYGKYGQLLIIETIAYTLIAILILVGIIDNRMYYILDTILFALIARNITCGTNRLTALRYNSKDKREKYDNNSNIVSSLSSLIGFTISFLLTIPVNIAFILLTIGICFDNIFYYQAYRESLHNKKCQY